MAKTGNISIRIVAERKLGTDNILHAMLQQHQFRVDGELNATLPPWAVTMINQELHWEYLFANAHILYKCFATGRIFTIFSPEFKFYVSAKGVPAYSWNEPKRTDSGLAYHEVQTLTPFVP